MTYWWPGAGTLNVQMVNKKTPFGVFLLLARQIAYRSGGQALELRVYAMVGTVRPSTLQRHP
jgi:hypothetical protein